MYDETDTDKAYETFLIIFRSLYDKHCPFKTIKIIFLMRNHGWQRAYKMHVKKIYTLYKEFIKQNKRSWKEV